MLKYSKMDEIPSALMIDRLRAIEAQVMKEDFGPKKSANLIPFKTDVPRGVEEWGYEKVTSYGLSEFVSGIHGDIPMAAVKTERATHKPATHRLGYEVHEEEMLKAANYGFPIDSAKAEAVLNGVEMRRDSVLINGADQLGWEGFINHSLVPTTSAANYGGGATWAAKTADERFRDVKAWQDLIRTQSKESVDWQSKLVLVLPDDQYAMVGLPRASGTDTTLEEYLLRNVRGLEAIIPLAELNGAGAGGTDRAILYRRDPMVLAAHFAYLATFDAEERKPYLMRRFMSERLLGLVIQKPLAMLYIDGI